MLDDALLSDETRLLAADHDGILRAVATAGAQVRATAEAAREAGVQRELSGLEYGREAEDGQLVRHVRGPSAGGADPRGLP